MKKRKVAPLEAKDEKGILFEEQLTKVFDVVDADKTGRISEQDFLVAVKTLQLNLSEQEARRIFSQSLRVSHAEQELTFPQFRKLVKSFAFFHSIVSNYHPEAFPTLNVSSYDWTMPTDLVYRHPDYKFDPHTGRSHIKTYSLLEHGPLEGHFVSIRRRLDFSYHTNYTKERQLWQDRMVRNVALRHAPSARPWLIFTSGAMGAGKGYVLRWMSQMNIFPLEQVVRIDPDYFKMCMPEWPGYCRESHDPGGMCHRESGLMQELCQEVSMQLSQNTWIDGSLQDYAWWIKFFNAVRERFPRYRIAVFHIHCSPEQVFLRARHRGEETGRVIPEEILRKNIQKTAESIKILGPLSDFLAIIDNEGRIPELEVVEDRSHSFKAIRDRFASSELSTFPTSLPVQFTSRRKESQPKLCLNQETCRALRALLPSQILRLPFSQVFPDLRALGQMDIAQCQLLFSACAPIQLDLLSREVAGVPETARSSCWCYGLEEGRTRVTQVTALDRGLFLEKATDLLCISGGFVFMDDTPAVVSVNTTSPSFSSDCQVMLQYGAPIEVPRAFANNLGTRLVQTTIPEIIEGGGTSYAWLIPGELPECPHGAFVYRLEVCCNMQCSCPTGQCSCYEPKYLAFPVQITA